MERLGMALGIRLVRAEQDDRESLSLHDELRLLYHLKNLLDRLNERYEAQQAKVTSLMDGVQKTATIDTPSGKRRATFVQSTRVKYDEDGLRKALGVRVFNRFTKRVLDLPKLEGFVNSGEVDINVVAAHSAVTKSKPHIRFSEPSPEDEDA